MKEQIIKLIEESSRRYWNLFPQDGVDEVDDKSEEGIAIDKINAEIAEDIIKLLK